jgi:hypothetical protein
MNVFEAAPEQETVIAVAKAPAIIGRLGTVLIAAAILALAAGGVAFYRMRVNQPPAQPPALQPTLPSITAPLVTRPQATIPATSAASGSIPQETAGTVTTTTSPSSSSITSPSPSTFVSGSKPAPRAAVQDKEQASSPARKNIGSGKKKKKTPPAH